MSAAGGVVGQDAVGTLPPTALDRRGTGVADVVESDERVRAIRNTHIGESHADGATRRDRAVGDDELTLTHARADVDRWSMIRQQGTDILAGSADPEDVRQEGPRLIR